MPEPEIQLPEINNETTNESVEGASGRVGTRVTCPAIRSSHNFWRPARKDGTRVLLAEPGLNHKGERTNPVEGDEARIRDCHKISVSIFLQNIYSGANG